MGMLLVALTFAVYQPVWHAGFIWDDDSFLTNNPVIKAGNGLYRLWFTVATPDYFPLTSSTLWLEWHLWGKHALGYHLVNVLLHALSAVLLWRILLRLKIPGAWVGAALFALHPVNVESVAWITERKNTLCMFFYLCAILAWMKDEDGEKKGWYVWAWVAFTLALLSKTAATPLPLVLLGLAWWRRGRIRWKDLRRTGPFFAIAAVLAVVTVWFQYHQSIGQEVVRSDNLWSRLAGAGWAVWFYFYKTVLPLNLMFVYPRWRIDAHNVLSYVPLVLLIVLFVVLWQYRRSWGKGLFCALSYDVLLLLPVLGFLNIYFMKYSLVADHWQYFAMIGPLVLAGALLARKPVVAGLVLVALCGLTWKQCGMYANAETLWRTTVKQNPGSWMAHYCLAHAVGAEGRNDEAIAEFKKGIQLKPDIPEAHMDLALACRRKGDMTAAISQYEKALKLKADLPEACNGLALVLDSVGRRDEAVSNLLTALKYKPDYDEPHYNLGLIYLHQDRVADAIAQFKAALQINPQHDKALANLGIALARQGRLDEAIHCYQDAIALMPTNAYAHNALGQALEDKNQFADAAVQYADAIAAQPDLADAREHLGAILIMQGKFSDAEEHLTQALKLKPDLPSAHFNLGVVLAHFGQTNEAAGHFRAALRLHPSPDMAAQIKIRLQLLHESESQ